MAHTVLVVEDDPTLARSIARNLDARGYATRCALTVAGAAAAIREGCPEVVLLDIDLPDGSGWEVLRGLRAGDYADAAVIVMSALQPNRRLCAELGTMAVLEKPFPMESLLRLVAQALAETTGPRQRGDGKEG